ncbi:hypothetical protein [Paenibacillus sp.]|uniref:hypothetical protein n=1 Tax=Paenibacillus sp. TaxID=58172 RepID=UPI0028A7CB48|nr:hypothetical protein [Paenibacillus sp.]
MKRFRSAMAGLLAMLLIFSSLPVMGIGSGSVGAEGEDITAQASLNVMSSDIATFTNSSLHGLKAGSTDFTVTVGNDKRVYTLEVVLPDGGSSPGASVVVPTPTPAANNDAQLRAKATAGQALIEISANGDGIARFSAEALRNAAAFSPNAVLVIASGDMSYQFPLGPVESVLKAAQMPAGTLEFQLIPLSGKGLEQLLAKAKQQGFTVQGTPESVTLKVTDGKTSVPANGFGTTYVDRTFMMEGALVAKTGEVLIYDEQTGSFRYVPALFELVGGMTKVTVKSSSASGIFVVAQHPITFGIFLHTGRRMRLRCLLVD